MLFGSGVSRCSVFFVALALGLSLVSGSRRSFFPLVWFHLSSFGFDIVYSPNTL